MTALHLLEIAHERGLVLIPDGDKIRIRGSRSVVAELIEDLRAHKSEIVAVLRKREPKADAQDRPGSLATDRGAQRRTSRWAHDEACRCTYLCAHFAAGGSFEAWNVSHADDRGAPGFSLDEMMSGLAPLAPPCGACGRSVWRWDQVGRLYKCQTCHPPIRKHKK